MSNALGGLPAGLTRRGALQFLAAGGVAGLTGCCAMRPFPTPAIPAEAPPVGTPLKPVVKKSPGAPKLCIDAHTHFFNGTDVPVKGYLEGPVAHDKKEPLRSLLRALAPLADALVEIAPTAAREFNDLVGKFSAAKADMMIAGVHPLSKAAVTNDRLQRSQDFYRIVKGSEFERQYNAIKRNQGAEQKVFLAAHEVSLLGPNSLFDASNASIAPRAANLLNFTQKRVVESVPYADGILAFVDHMLSPRWQNLRDYADVYSTAEDGFGIDFALGALVDFDRWLECPPRSSHDDQVKLHQLLSQLSGGYMRPLVAYNPWSDIMDSGASLTRVKNAIERRGFVGVKIYPPNGFYPYGNTSRTIPPTLGPSFAELDRVLGDLWNYCLSAGVPVMAHTNDSSGKDNDFDKLGGPPGWLELLKRYQNQGAPLVNLGHFGGAGGGTDWTAKFADMMTQPAGARIYGDVAFWDDLRCRDEDTTKCTEAKARLGAALQRKDVNRHVMYGTDWFMLSTERDWGDYPFEMQAAIKDLPVSQDDFFGLNAQRCFARANLQPAA